MEIFRFSVYHRVIKLRPCVCHLLNRPIECFIPVGGGVKGVVYISPDITESALIENLQGAEIETARRFKQDGTAVLLTFKQETINHLLFSFFQVQTILCGKTKSKFYSVNTECK